MDILDREYKVSVIVPIYNVEEYIEKCARSLFAQTLDDIEYIFVNDCTPDNSIEVLLHVIEEYECLKHRITIINNETNLGLAQTRDVGLKASHGKYIYNCDSDDWVETNMLEVMYNKAIEEDADMVCCNIVLERLDSRTIYRYPYSYETLENGLLALKFGELYNGIWNKLIKRDLYFKNHIWHYPGINMGEDSAVTVRLRYFSKKTVIVPAIFYHYNRSNVNSMCIQLPSTAIYQYIELSNYLEIFFIEQNERIRFRVVISALKFISKQNILRQERDYSKWYSIFPESHQYIFKYSFLSRLGRFKWYLCAHLPYIFKLIIKPKGN